MHKNIPVMDLEIGGKACAIQKTGRIYAPEHIPLGAFSYRKTSENLFSKKLNSSQLISIPSGRIQYWSERLNPRLFSSSPCGADTPNAAIASRTPCRSAGMERPCHHRLSAGLVYGEDSFRKLTPEELEEERLAAEQAQQPDMGSRSAGMERPCHHRLSADLFSFFL